MENNQSSNKLSLFIKKHWFQIIIVGFLLIVLMRKDFSFQINMNNPDKVEEPASHPMQNKQKQKELLTQKAEKESIKESNTGILERFGLSFIGGGNASNPKSEYSKIDEKVIGSYLKRFAQVAISESKKYGVPTSIILANSIFHSFAGTRDMAEIGNNHFAIACTSDWNGERGAYQNKCYRQYENAWTSFRDHSLFVTSGKYSNLLQYGTSDYKSWAKGLEKARYSEFSDLEKNLINIIEKHELYQLDIK